MVVADAGRDEVHAFPIDDWNPRGAGNETAVAGPVEVAHPPGQEPPSSDQVVGTGFTPSVTVTSSWEPSACTIPTLT